MLDGGSRKGRDKILEDFRAAGTAQSPDGEQVFDGDGQANNAGRSSLLFFRAAARRASAWSACARACSGRGSGRRALWVRRHGCGRGRPVSIRARNRAGAQTGEHFCNGKIDERRAHSNTGGTRNWLSFLSAVLRRVSSTGRLMPAWSGRNGLALERTLEVGGIPLVSSCCRRAA